MTFPSVPLSKVTKAKGLIGGPFGSSLVSKDYETSGVPVIRGGNLIFGKSVGGKFAFVSEDKVAADLARNTAIPGDLIFTQRGTLGQVALVPHDSFPKFVISQSQMRLRVDPEIALSDYMYYTCSTPSFLKQIDDNAITTGVPHINLGILSRLTVPLPSLDDQTAIAELLGAIDDKIAANTRLAETAMQQGEALYRQTLQTTGCDYVAISSVATTVLGGTPSRSKPEFWTNGTVGWLNSGKVNENRIIEPTTYITQEALNKSAAKLMPVGATLVAITGATLGQMARLEMSAAGNQSIVGIWTDNETSNAWLHFAVQGHRADLLTKATGAAQQHVNKGDVDKLLIPWPDIPTLESVGSVVSDLLDVATAADRERLTLSVTRDALLPHLISGKLRVQEIETLISAAV